MNDKKQMTECFSEEIIEKEIQKGTKDFKLGTVLARYFDKYKQTPVDILFCEDKALWFSKFKGQYYGNYIKITDLDGILAKNKFFLLDTYCQLKDQAARTLKALYAYKK